MMLLPILLSLISFSPAHAALRTEIVSYKHGDVALEGALVYDDSFKKPRPGVLVLHEWWGHGPYVRKRAEELAKLGYVAFAADMYGKGIYAKNHEEAGALSGAFRKNRQLMRERALVGLEVLRKNPRTNANKLAAIGYCFGGTSALELARAGTALAGVVSFHGGLDTPNPETTTGVKAKILVLTGADDKFVSSSIPAFEEEMRKAQTDWQLVSYGGAVHSFTVKEAGNDPSKGMAYNEKADRRSWQAMRDFLGEVFE